MNDQDLDSERQTTLVATRTIGLPGHRYLLVSEKTTDPVPPGAAGAVSTMWELSDRNQTAMVLAGRAVDMEDAMVRGRAARRLMACIDVIAGAPPVGYPQDQGAGDHPNPAEQDPLLQAIVENALAEARAWLASRKGGRP